MRLSRVDKLPAWHRRAPSNATLLYLRNNFSSLFVLSTELCMYISTFPLCSASLTTHALMSSLSPDMARLHLVVYGLSFVIQLIEANLGNILWILNGC